MSRRDQIKMSDEEVGAFLDEERTVICATAGRDGWPHLMPLWYVVRDADRVAELGREIFARYGGVDVATLDDGVREMVAKQASKRVGLRFVARDRATWDHRKLAAGVY